MPATVDVVEFGSRGSQGQASKAALPEAPLLEYRRSDGKVVQSRARYYLELIFDRIAALPDGYGLCGTGWRVRPGSGGRYG